MLVVVKDEVVRLGVMGVEDEMLVVESRQVPWECLLCTGTGIEVRVRPTGRQCRPPETTSTRWDVMSSRT